MMPDTTAPEPLIDPDCRDGKHGSCVGAPCECRCHVTAAAKAEAAVWRDKLTEATRRAQAPAPEHTPPDDTTEGTRHEPMLSADCRAERHDSDTTHVCRWFAGHDSAAHNCMCGHSWEDSFEDRVLAGFVPAFVQAMQGGKPDDTTAPVTADGLRERIAEVVTRWALMYPLGNWGIWGTADGASRDQLAEIAEDIAAGWGRDIADRVLAALAGDPGDLPARMAEALAIHDYGTDVASIDGAIADRYRARAKVAMSVRWEDHATTVAQLAAALARAEHAEGQLSAHRDHETRWELEKAGREQAERDNARWRNAIGRVLAKPLMQGPNATLVVRIADIRAAMDAPASPDGAQ